MRSPSSLSVVAATIVGTLSSGCSIGPKLERSGSADSLSAIQALSITSHGLPRGTDSLRETLEFMRLSSTIQPRDLAAITGLDVVELRPFDASKSAPLWLIVSDRPVALLEPDQIENCERLVLRMADVAHKGTLPSSGARLQELYTALCTELVHSRPTESLSLPSVLAPGSSLTYEGGQYTIASITPGIDGNRLFQRLVDCGAVTVNHSVSPDTLQRHGMLVIDDVVRSQAWADRSDLRDHPSVAIRMTTTGIAFEVVLENEGEVPLRPSRSVQAQVGWLAYLSSFLRPIDPDQARALRTEAVRLLVRPSLEDA